MKLRNKRVVSFILCLALALTMCLYPVPAEASGPAGVTFADGDADHVYFSGDTLSFNITNIPGIMADTPARVSLGLIGAGGGFVPTEVVAGLTDGSADSTGHYQDTTILAAGGTFSADVTGTVAGGLTIGAIAVQIYIDMNGGAPGGWTNLLQGQTPDCIPLTFGGNPVLVGVDTVLAAESITCDPVLGSGSQAAENLYDLDIAFSKTIAAGVTGSIAFNGLNLFESNEDLANLDEGMNMNPTMPAIDEESAYIIGIDESALSNLADDGATISVSSASFAGLTVDSFDTSAVSGTGTISNLRISGDTVSFDVNHFSDYKMTKQDLQARIDQAKTVMGSSFTAVQGIDTNLITSLEAKSGMNATGVDIVSVISTSATDLPITKPTGTITYNSSSHTGSVSLELGFGGLTDSAVLAVTVPAIDEIKPVPGGDGGGGGGGGGGESTGQTPQTPSTVTRGNTVTSTTTVNGTMDSATGKTKAALTKDSFTPMIDNVKKAESSGQQAVVEIKVDSTAQSREIAVEIPKASFKQLADETKAQVAVTSPLGTVAFDEKAVQAISKAAGGDIQISMAKVDTAGLSSDIRELVGDAPVYDFTVQSGNSKISDFKGGSANVSVPYALKEGDDPNAVVVCYISGSGALETVRGAYDPDTHTVKFVTDHFSKYAIAYHEVGFEDVTDAAWYKDAVGFIAARGITTGTDKNHFSPNAKLTRAQFLVMVMKAYGIEPAADPSDNFADSGNAYYTTYLAKAKELGLANGDGNNLFGPNRDITRQDMFTLLYRTLDLIGEIPESTGSASLSDFIDAGSVRDYAKTPMETFAAAGIVTGSYDMLTPQNTSTRAEMAQVLFNLLSKSN